MASTSFSLLSPAMDSTSTSRTRIYKKTKQAAVQQWHGKPQLVRKGKKGKGKAAEASNDQAIGPNTRRTMNATKNDIHSK